MSYKYFYETINKNFSLMNQRKISLIFSFVILLYSTGFVSGQNLTKLKDDEIGIGNLEEKNQRSLEYDTYMILYFKEKCTYSGGFQNDYRKGISYIFNTENEAILTSKQYLYLYKDSRIDIHFNETVKSLEKFFDYNSDLNVKYLITIDLSHFDTSSVTNMDGLFFGCSSLETIVLSHFKTSLVSKMGYMFGLCSSLRSIDLSHFDTSLVTRMSYIFSGCSKLKSIDVSHFDTSSVVDMAGMFSRCSSLKILDLSNFDTSSVIEMGNMFSECSSINSIKIYNFDTSAIINMGGIFSGCSSLKSIDLSNFNTSSVTKMYSMFSGCSSLKSIDLSNFDTSSVTTMYSMFSDCKLLEIINLSSFDTSLVTDMDYMFYECYSLKGLDIFNFNMINCISYYYMFGNYKNIRYINLYNFRNDKIISRYFNAIDNLSVCQSNNIITNPNINFCCDYNFESNICNSNFTPNISYISDNSLIKNETKIESSSTSEIKIYTTVIIKETELNKDDGIDIDYSPEKNQSKKYSSKKSIGIIIGIIAVIIIFISILTIIICHCKKKKEIPHFQPVEFGNLKSESQSIKKLDASIIHEYHENEAKKHKKKDDI